MAKKKADELKAQLARALADYDNLTKRVERERGDYAKMANLMLVGRLLPVVDMLESAQAHLKDAGLAIAIKEFEEAFSEQGVVQIKASKGIKYDEELHEAVEVAKNGKSGEIVKVVLTGWKFVDGPIIRPAKVKVGGK